MNEESIILLKEKIKIASKILLINHIRMDPDALGSLGAFYILLEKLGKTVQATNDESMPENYSFLTQKQIIESPLDIQSFAPELIISFDAASIEQLGNTYIKNKDIFEKTDFFVIDHHITNPGFGKYNIINTETSSSCELVYDIIQYMGFEDMINSSMATLLLAGIHTDTNSFYNKNTSPDTLKKAAILIEKGGDQREVIFEFFRKKSLEKVKLWGQLLQNTQSSVDGKIVWICVKHKQFSSLSIGDQGLKGLLNEFLANIEGAEVAFLLYETGAGVKASLRSNKDSIDVAQLCTQFGGGGHKLAAGFTTQKTLEETEKELLSTLM